jgi:tetratricopeptide (TPR) repeat protein
MSEEAREFFRQGMERIESGDMEESSRLFEKAYKLDRENPLYMSYYGMSAALRWGKIGLGIELCTKAVKKEFFKAEHYLNLAKVYVAADNKKGAITVLRKGVRFDPENAGIHDMLMELGVRKRPIIPFLKRSNPVNRLLGIFLRRTLPALLKKKKEETLEGE